MIEALEPLLVRHQQGKTSGPRRDEVLAVGQERPNRGRRGGSDVARCLRIPQEVRGQIAGPSRRREGRMSHAPK